MNTINFVLKTHCVHISMPYEVGQLFVSTERNILACVYRIHNEMEPTQYEIKVFTETFPNGAYFVRPLQTAFNVQNVSVSDNPNRVEVLFAEDEVQQVFAGFQLMTSSIEILGQCAWIDSDFHDLIRQDVAHQVRLRQLEIMPYRLGDTFRSMENQILVFVSKVSLARYHGDSTYYTLSAYKADSTCEQILVLNSYDETIFDVNTVTFKDKGPNYEGLEQFTADQFNAVKEHFGLTSCAMDDINQCDWGALKDLSFRAQVVEEVRILKVGHGNRARQGKRKRSEVVPPQQRWSLRLRLA